MVLVDYRKAFDMVDHRLWLRKLKFYGIVNKEFELFPNWLADPADECVRKGSYNIGGRSG